MHVADDRPLPGRKYTVYFTLIAAMDERKHLDASAFIRAAVDYTRNDPQCETYAIHRKFETGIREGQQTEALFHAAFLARNLGTKAG